jgi:hypothetical protein
MSRFIVPMLAALVAWPVAAQEWQVAREQFVFAGSRLTIQVDVESPGTLRLVRGEPGSVRVAGRSRDGFTGSGLAEDDHLTLTAAGAGPVDYLVAVPENVWVRLRLPGEDFGENIARGKAGAWDWLATQEIENDPGVPRWLPGIDPETGDDVLLYTTFSRDFAPGEVEVPDLSNVARITVRIEGFRFKVIASRPLSVEMGDPRRLVIQPADPPMELVLAVPPVTPAFTLKLGAATALVIDGASVATLCTPVTDQQLSDGRRWFTFNPLGESLDCDGGPVQRHGG